MLHDHVQRPITVLADHKHVRPFDRRQLIAEHERSWDKQQVVENPAHEPMRASVEEAIKSGSPHPSKRYEHKPLLLTTNKPFGEWGEVFPNATSVVTLVDRLVHRCDIVSVEGESYRLKESMQTAKRRAQKRAARKFKS